MVDSSGFLLRSSSPVTPVTMLLLPGIGSLALIPFSRRKTIMALEGGYNLNLLANSVLACVEVLLEEKPTAESFEAYPFASTWRVIKAVREQLSEYWPILAEKLSGKLTSRITPQLQFDGPNTLSEDLGEDVRIPLSKLDFSEDVRTQIIDLKEKLTQQLTANANLASDILAKDKTIADKDKTIADMDKSIVDKDKTLADKGKTIAEKIIVDKGKTVADKDKVIEELKRKIQEIKFRTKQLEKQRDAILDDRRMLITKGLPHLFLLCLTALIFLFRSPKKCSLNMNLAVRRVWRRLKWTFFPSIALENMEGYDGTVQDRYKQACKEFDEMEYPYLKEIAANADKPFEFIMNIKPKSIPLENMEGYTSNVFDMCRQACKMFARMKFAYIEEIIANADKPLEFLKNINSANVSRTCIV